MHKQQDIFSKFEQLLDEKRILEKCVKFKIKNMGALVDVFEDNLNLYMVTEHPEGKSLKDYQLSISMSLREKEIKKIMS